VTSAGKKDKIQNSRETETMSIQKKSLVSAIKTTRKANLVKDESAGTVSPATKAPLKKLPLKKLPLKKLPLKKLPLKKLPMAKLPV
jgi:hypothetical protein